MTPPQQFDLTGKIVWVTGAGKGLGRAVSSALSEAGAVVALTSRTESDLLELADELQSPDVDVLPASIDDPAAVSAVVAEIIRRHGRLDGLINCAGISPSFRRSESISDEDWHRVIATNLTGTFTCCRAVAEVMLPQGSGSIVNITSVHASVGFGRIAAYAASKGGMTLSPRHSPSSGRTAAYGSMPWRRATSAPISVPTYSIAGTASASEPPFPSVESVIPANSPVPSSS